MVTYFITDFMFKENLTAKEQKADWIVFFCDQY
jgi:hypothetical protein